MELLSLAVVALMIGSMLLWRIPAATCDQCEHCRETRRAVERERQDEWHRKVHAWSGGEHCPICRPDG
jgi:hypothetical protein